MSEISFLKSVSRDPAVLAASLLANLLALAVPLAMLQIYDRVIPYQAHETMIVLAAMVLFALAVDSVLRVSRTRILSYFTACFEQRAYSRAFWSVIMEDPARRERIDPGTLVSRLSAVDRLRGQRADGAAGAILDVPFALLFLALMAFLSPVIAATVAAMLLLTFFVLRFQRRAVDEARLARFRIEARRHSFLSEVLSGIRSVRSLQIGDLINRRQERLLGQSADRTRDITRAIHQAQGITAAVGGLTPVVTAATAGYLVLAGEASMGVLAAAVVLSGRIVQPVLRVEGYLSSLETSRQAEADLAAITDVALRSAGDLPLRRVDRLEVRDAATARDTDFGIALCNIDVSLERGDCLLLQSEDPVRTAVAARLFLGELELTSGWITVNGRALSSYRLEDRQDRIRLLSDDAKLLEGTLFENICAFRPDIHRETALALARDLGLQKILRANPRGLQMQVRSDGDGLPQSVQRIACNIAGLASRPDVVVFLAANSGLDMETDQALLAWLARHAADHILILATNRPSYMSLATKTLDLDAGRRRFAPED